MRSSATTGIRAFVMLACAVGIPLLAMSGSSWQEILKKFQNFRFPAILERASASTTPPLGEAPRFEPTAPVVEIQPSPAAPIVPTLFADSAKPAAVPSDFSDIQKRLQQLGATYYVLESWGNGQELYRFCCKMAVGDNADYVHCFEATGANPRQTMQQVLQQVETWRQKNG